jgi:hypothetical protein
MPGLYTRPLFHITNDVTISIADVDLMVLCNFRSGTKKKTT